MFKIEKAKKVDKKLVISLSGMHGSGKTVTALRLSTGIAEREGGRVVVIDTEAGRAATYADNFDFDHLILPPPFRAETFIEAINHCEKEGYSTIVIDSFSHEHEGEGGLLEQHDEYLDGLFGDNHAQRHKGSQSAWGKVKKPRKRLVTKIAELTCNIILCFRAKTESVAYSDQPAAKLVPIAGREFFSINTVSLMLDPEKKGRPLDVSAFNRVDEIGNSMKKILFTGSELTEQSGHDLHAAYNQSNLKPKTERYVVQWPLGEFKEFSTAVEMSCHVGMCLELTSVDETRDFSKLNAGCFRDAVSFGHNDIVDSIRVKIKSNINQEPVIREN